MGNDVTLQVFEGTEGIPTNAEVVFLRKSPSLKVSDQLAGRFFNAYGDPIDGGPAVEGKEVENPGALMLDFPGNLVVVGGMYMAVHQNRGVVFFNQLHQRVKAPVGRVLVVPQSCRGRMGYHDVHAAHALQFPPELRDAPAHLLVGVLVGAGVISPAAAQTQNPDTVVLHDVPIDAVAATGTWSDVIYMPCTAETGFAPELPEKTPDIIYLCFPNNPTGATITKDELQKWVDYANKVGAVIIYDAAYEAYITEENVPHSIYECEGARTCAIELRSFSKNAGFTGVRLGATVIPKDLKCGDVMLHSLWARRHGTKYNGAPYIVQKAGEAVYSEAGKAQLKEQIAYYQKNAKTIFEGLKNAGYTVSGAVNSPYIWLKTPDNMTSWEFFDYLLEKANVVGTPGSGFGPSGEGYFRLTAFGSYENTLEAIKRIQSI